MSKELDEFTELLKKKTTDQITPEVIWAVVDSVDWQEKTMDVKSTVDGLPYYDVLLGLGSFYRKPKLGTKCVIARLENTVGTILIDAEEFEEAILISDESEFTIKKEGFIVKVGNDSLKEVWNDFFDAFKNLSGELKKVVVSIGVTPNVPAIEQIENTVETDIKPRLNNILTE